MKGTVKGQENGVLTNLLLTVKLDNPLDGWWKTWIVIIFHAHGLTNKHYHLRKEKVREKKKEMCVWGRGQ